VEEYRQLQRLAGSVIMRSLGEDFMMQHRWIDGRDMNDVAADFIKPNDRLTSFERIEIYNRQYWYRLIDILYDDYPGLLAIIGSPKFSKLTRAYLTKYPSRSFSLRNLGSRLEQFLIEEPHWVAPYEKMAQDMARFEWAQTVAFDGPVNPPITMDDLAGQSPDRLKLGVQPYITVMELAYPLDEFSLAIKRRAVRSEASNAMGEEKRREKTKTIRRPRKRQTFVAVHRHDNELYFKRLDPAAFVLLTALSEGKTLAEACERVEGRATAKKINLWFTTWMSLGWFCGRE
jgi:hypothetical protein